MICFEALFAALIAYKLQGVAYLYAPMAPPRRRAPRAVMRSKNPELWPARAHIAQ